MTKADFLVTLERKKDKENLHGFLMGESEKWLLIQSERDFLLDGYRILPKKDVKKIRHNAVDRLHEKMCAGEGLAAKLRALPRLSIENPEGIFRFLKLKEEIVIVECEYAGEWPFSFGKIGRIAADAVEIQYFDVMGKKEGKPRTVWFKDISQIGFQERYMKVYRKYFQW